MTIEIRSRFSPRVIFTALATISVADALWWAISEGVDLRNADFRNADLGSANLRNANLSGADFSGACLANADLADADLFDVNLSGANLSGVNLADANLKGADLTDAKLTGAKLSWTILTNVLLTPEQLAQLGLQIPRVTDLDRKVLAAVTSEGGRLDMAGWHDSDSDQPACGSTHCRAGWAIHLSGEAGYALEDKVGPGVAGALIYLSSTQRPVPHFGVSTEEALADIQRCATLNPSP